MRRYQFTVRLAAAATSIKTIISQLKPSKMQNIWVRIFLREFPSWGGVG